MSRNDRNLLILGSLGIVVLIIIFYFLLLSPLLGNLNEQAKARDDKQAQLDQVQQEVNELEEVRRNSPEIERQLLELSKRIPTQPQIPTFVVQVQEIAGDAGVTQLLVEPGDAAAPADGGEYQVIPVTMQFNGTYDEMQDFLLRTRNLARLVTVTNVDYSRAANETTTSNQSVETLLDVEIQAEVYYQPTDATSGEVPPTVVPETTTPEQPEETTSGG
jgi:type IV pilus assembly protein PilO